MAGSFGSERTTRRTGLSAFISVFLSPWPVTGDLPISEDPRRRFREGCDPVEQAFDGTLGREIARGAIARAFNHQQVVRIGVEPGDRGVGRRLQQLRAARIGVRGQYPAQFFLYRGGGLRRAIPARSKADDSQCMVSAENRRSP